MITVLTARRLAAWRAVLGAIVLVGAGCSPALDVGFDSPDPQGRTVALARAANEPNGPARDVSNMIVMLNSVDPAQRMLAIKGLERRTGQTLGYRHYAPEPERVAAQERWARWWAEQPESAGALSIGGSP